MDEACLNTDKEIWRKIPGDLYSPSIHVTEFGGIGINVGGYVLVAPVEKWHEAGVKHLTVPDPNSLKGKEGRTMNDKKLESIKNPYADILRELETGLWEHDVRVDDGIAKPYSYDDETFRACLKIFMSAIMWKLWEHMEKTEGMDKDKRIERVKKIGKAIRKLIFENTGIDAHELY